MISVSSVTTDWSCRVVLSARGSEKRRRNWPMPFGVFSADALSRNFLYSSALSSGRYFGNGSPWSRLYTMQPVAEISVQRLAPTARIPLTMPLTRQ